MEDDELKAIRARRLAELQGKSGGSSPQVIIKIIYVLNRDFDN
jgi:DNA-binding TFAR19-related protein (PDSD5 family)